MKAYRAIICRRELAPGEGGHRYRRQCRSPRAVEQGQARRAEGTVKLKNIRPLHVRLQMEGRVREPGLLNLGIYSKLRGCDLVGLKVRDVCHGEQVASRGIVVSTRRSVPLSQNHASGPGGRSGLDQARWA